VSNATFKNTPIFLKGPTDPSIMSDRPQLRPWTDLQDVYGFGPVLAPQFLREWGGRRGIRPDVLAGLAANGHVDLTWMQTVGLRYHGRFRGHIPRSEVRRLARDIRDRWDRAECGVRVFVCGSYRRGRPFCNDLDLLVVRARARARRDLDGSGTGPGASCLADLLGPLREGGLVPADGDLVRHPLQKFMGFCWSAGAETYRRLDICWVDDPARAPMALLDLTGSVFFLRALQDRARELGARLGSRRLVWLPGPDGRAGTDVPNIRSERDIFIFLGLAYVPPGDRSY